MTTIRPQRDQMIRAAVMQRPDAIAEVSIHLWEKLARELVSIIGEGGFQSLYNRSLHLVGATFPWLEINSSLPQNSSGFADLKECLAGQDSTNASEASAALLITFIDILALLIGELLTSSILRLAWGDDVLDTVVKELP
ncbi:hypothetical protein [Herminiimonas aquatilis]|uniref:TetR family transcriptional regulator n=1 Tax=Herminiimonas aquatilis TaxID=345342 RepID=A0ABW2J2S7_9BURK